MSEFVYNFGAFSLALSVGLAVLKAVDIIERPARRRK